MKKYFKQNQADIGLISFDEEAAESDEKQSMLTYRSMITLTRTEVEKNFEYYSY